MNTHCLNCNTELTGKYCTECGQKADTHRISLKHFISHDLLHGTFHLEKGMLFTTRQVLTRPGRSALEYIAGKRVNYYNIFYFILVIIGFNIVLVHYYNKIAFTIDPSLAIVAKVNEAGKTLSDILKSYGKFFIFAILPLTAMNSYFIFNRKKLNFLEHIILSGMILLGLLLIGTMVFMLSFFALVGIPLNTTLLWLITAIGMYAYVMYAYYDAFRRDYTAGAFLFRLICFLLLFFTQAAIFIFIIVGISVGWQSGTELQFEF